MKPPSGARWLLERTLPPGVRGETILGDLIEDFGASGGSARRSFWRQAVSLAIYYGWRRLRGLDRHHDAGQEGTTMFDSLRQDSRYALRSWSRAPGFAGIIIATLALGIGAATAIFSLANGILLRPLPYPEPDSLVYLNEVNTTGDQISVSWPNFLDWRSRQHSFEELALSRSESFIVSGAERSQRIRGRRITGNLLAVLGARLHSGPGFTAAEDRAGTEAKVIISHGFWQEHFGGDPAVIGRSLALDGRSHAVVGVLPAGWRYLDRNYDLFVPIGLLADDPQMLMRGNHRGFHAIGRLRAGVILAAAAAEMGVIAADLTRAYGDTNSGVGVRATALHAQLVADVRLTLLVLLGAVGFLLLLSCVNVANLLVARGAARQRELSVRAALGCGRLRLVRQLLVESTLISGAGAVLGTLLAWGLLALLLAGAPDGTPRLNQVRLDGSALLFAFGAAALCGIVFGAFPAFQASGIRGQQAVARSRSGGISAQSHRLRRGLVVVEVALALVLLVGAGLTTRSLQRLTAVDTGFRPDHLLTARLSLGGERWTEAAARDSFLAELLERLRATASFRSVALAQSLPIEGAQWYSIFLVRDKPEPGRGDLPSAAFTPVSAGYFETLGMRLARGRPFDQTDTGSSPKTAIVNETLARRLWPGEDPIGKLLKQGWPESPTPWREVVGVAGDVKFEGIAEPTPMQVYLPLTQEPTDAPAVVVRALGPPEAARAELGNVVRSLDKSVPIYDLRTMDELLGSSMGRQRVTMLVLLVFAAVALTLAAVGLYGVVAHGVTERTHEIGVRLALGAERTDVLRLVIGQGLSISVAGIVLGLCGALALSRSMQGLLFGVAATDPWTLSLVVLMLLGVTVAACFLPARRFARLDPARAFREE